MNAETLAPGYLAHYAFRSSPTQTQKPRPWEAGAFMLSPSQRRLTLTTQSITGPLARCNRPTALARPCLP